MQVKKPLCFAFLEKRCCNWSPGATWNFKTRGLPRSNPQHRETCYFETIQLCFISKATFFSNTYFFTKQLYSHWHNKPLPHTLRQTLRGWKHRFHKFPHWCIWMIGFRDLGAEDVFVCCGSLLLNWWVCGQAGALLFYRRVVSFKQDILFSWRAKWSLCFCKVLGRNGPRFMVENVGFRDASAWLPHGFRENPLTLLVWRKSFHPCEADAAGNYIGYGLWTM